MLWQSPFREAAEHEAVHGPSRESLFVTRTGESKTLCSRFCFSAANANMLDSGTDVWLLCLSGRAVLPRYGPEALALESSSGSGGSRLLRGAADSSQP